MRQGGEFVFVHSAGVPGIVLLPIDETNHVVLLVPRAASVRVALVAESDLSQAESINEAMEVVIAARLGALVATDRPAPKED